MDADYSFYVKSIATYAPAFLGYNNSVVARVVLTVFWLLTASIGKGDTGIVPLPKASLGQAGFEASLS